MKNTLPANFRFTLDPLPLTASRLSEGIRARSGSTLAPNDLAAIAVTHCHSLRVEPLEGGDSELAGEAESLLEISDRKVLDIVFCRLSRSEQAEILAEALEAATDEEIDEIAQPIVLELRNVGIKAARELIAAIGWKMIEYES